MYRLILLGLVATAAASYDYKSLPELNYDTWWGPSNSVVDDPQIKDFKIKFDDALVEDIKARLEHTREFIPSMDNTNFTYGMNTQYFKYWVDYWKNKYNFVERETYLNQFQHKKAQVQGLWVHFIHVVPEVPEGKTKIPVLMLHGFPGSVREFYDAIPLITADSPDRDFVVELVIPSLPGFGYSDFTTKPGLGAAEMAFIFRNLMHKLGHKKFFVQGGDLGALIGANIATFFPDECLGYHTNMGLALTNSAFALIAAGSMYPEAMVPKDLVGRLYPLLDHIQHFAQESGYLHMLATKPDTVGICASQSPASLAGFILTLFSVGISSKAINSNTGDLEVFTPEQLIDNLMFYWAPNSATSAFRIFAETLNERNRRMGYINEPTPVPTAVVQAANELYMPNSALNTKFTNLVHVEALPDKGRFLAFEAPEIFSKSFLKGFQKIMEFRKTNNMDERGPKSPKPVKRVNKEQHKE